MNLTKKIVTESMTNDTMNFNFMLNTWCKFVLNIYDAGGLTAQCTRCPSAFTLGCMCADKSLDVPSDLHHSLKALLGSCI